MHTRNRMNILPTSPFTTCCISLEYPIVLRNSILQRHLFRFSMLKVSEIHKDIQYFMNYILFMLIIQESNFGFATQQILYQRNKYIEPFSPFIHFTKIIWFSTIESDSIGCNWFAIIVQLL